MGALPNKPAYGKPCNGCGMCCATEICPAGRMIFPADTPTPCPALRWDGEKTRCGLVLTEERFGMEPLLRKALGIGEGCSMEDR